MNRRLNILLIKPYQDSNEVIPPLGLGYLASTVRKEHDVEILDGILLKLTEKKLKKKLRKKKYDVIGIQCYSSDLFTVIKYNKIIKKIQPQSLIIVGGPQISALPIYSLKTIEYADFGFIGESEYGFKKLIELYKKVKTKADLSIEDFKNIPGLVYRIVDAKGSTKIVSNDPLYVENLDELDPSYDLFNLKNYPLAPHGAYCKQYPTAPIIITRGCPQHCNFCGGSLVCGKRIRKHSINYVIEKIKQLHFRYGIREIHIEDDNFSHDSKYVTEFCQRLIDLNLNISWICANGVRLDTLNEDLLKLMKKSGMYSISVGIESASPRIRTLMNKNLPTKVIFEKIKLIKALNIDCIGFFIIGYPDETEEEILSTIKLAKALPIIRANFSIFKPFPGTPIFKKLVMLKRIKKIKWNTYILHAPTWADEKLSIIKLVTLKWRAILEFYLRPKIFLGIFSRIKNITNLKYILFRIIRNMLKNF